MDGPFASARARDQVVAALDYAAYPGLAFLADGRANLVARAGSLVGADLSAIAEVIAHADELLAVHAIAAPVLRVPSSFLPPSSLPEQHVVLYSVLPKGFRLCVIAPVGVAADDVHRRVLRAQARLLRMMAGPRSSGGTNMGEHPDLFWAECPPPEDV